jgi:hypothetical protein
MTYEAYLIRRAIGFWHVGSRLPLNLFAEMLAAGLDVEEIEYQYTERYNDE